MQDRLGMNDKPSLEQNEDGEMLPAALPDGVALMSTAHKPGEIEKVAEALGLVEKYVPGWNDPREMSEEELRKDWHDHVTPLFPDVCAHPDCEKTPIVGVKKRFVCEDHVEWVMLPMRDLIKLVRDTFGD